MLLAEDSPTVRHHLMNIIDNAPDMVVVGEARDGAEALRMVEDLRPDIVSMDINMPDMDGLVATRLIMERVPTPIVVVSDLLGVDVNLSLQAIEAGALAVVGKPPHQQSPEFDHKQQHLLKTLRAMAGVKVISRRKSRHKKRAMAEMQGIGVIRSDTAIPRPEIIVIGASTGGPGALLKLLSEIPKNPSVPMVIVQHMPDEFIQGLVRWMGSLTGHQVMLAFHDMVLEKGMIVLAPGDANLILIRHDGLLRTQLNYDRGQSRYMPSVDSLFESVARTVGKRAVGIILTGMGDDGAKGLLAIRKAGGYTLVQDEDSSTVFGMPRAAIQLGAASKVVSLADLSSKIRKML